MRAGLNRAAMLSLVVCTLLAGCSRLKSQATGTDQAERGRVLTRWYGCTSCHQISGELVAGKVGPPLACVSGRTYLAGRLPNTPENMIRWIRFPQQVDELTAMPNVNVTEQDAKDIAAFLKTLR